MLGYNGRAMLDAADRFLLRRLAVAALTALLLGGAASVALGHGIEGKDQAFLLRTVGVQVGPNLYLGANHSVTGNDELVLLAGVIFFL